MIPVIFGLAGPELGVDERALFQKYPPAGYILFQRNCVDPDQIRALTAELKALAGRDDVPILIDQEGGRVARLKPPHWPEFPAARRFAELYARAPVSALDAARFNARAIAETLRLLGITVDCLPVLDVPVEGAHDIIGDRAYGAEPTQVAALGRATLEGLRQGGVVGVVKHIPGHGRARADSHLELPVVEASAAELAQDLAPFTSLADAPMAMTAHVVYSALDADRCATVSPVVIERVIRGEIGFQGLLMSDDLGMKALAGSFADKARACLAAGCDVALHCSGDFAEMREIAEAVPAISAPARDRLEAAMAWPRRTLPLDIGKLAQRRDALLALA